MKKDQLAFLFAGLAFGFLFGFALFWTIHTRPGAATAGGSSAIPSPAGPTAPTQAMGAGAPQGGAPAAQGGAPMMAEINALKDRVAKNPKDADAWTRLGNIYHDAQMYEPAIEFYGRASELRPADANVLTDTGICYQELRKFDKAVEYFEKAQKADPSHWQSLYNTAVVAGLAMGQFDRADAALAKLQQVKPDAPNLQDLKDALAKARTAPPETR